MRKSLILNSEAFLFIFAFMALGMHKKIPGGSVYSIRFEVKQQEIINVHLPPVGYVIDRLPDPKTGLAPLELIKSEIINDNLPIEDQKWTKPQLPPQFKKWAKEEKIRRRYEPEWVHPEAEKFRAREWTRRINGVWMALGNRDGKPSEYIYIPPSAYLYFAWWKPDFGSPKFRLVYLKIFYALQWAEDNPLVNGITFSGKRRLGKTAIAGCWTFDKPSRMMFGYGGMQAQSGEKAAEFFDINLVQPSKRMVPFFKPKTEGSNAVKKKLVFMETLTKTRKNDDSTDYEEYEEVEDSGGNSLGGRVTCVTSGETALDGKKLHRIWLDEPGKWEKVDVYTTVLKYIPCTEDETGEKIGLIFAPATIEKKDKGGHEFITLFEASLPSQMAINKTGKTETGLVALFIPAYEAYTFDEYGRSVIEDPKKNEMVFSEKGVRIIKGAKSRLLARRADKTTEEAKIEEIRKFPWSWFEAKLISAAKCQFNAMIITNRLEEIYASPRYIRGNFSWVGGKTDGDVEWVRDDVAGRFQAAWLPDLTGSSFEGNNKIINNVGSTWEDGKEYFFPKNDRLFAAGGDPFKYKVKSDDPRLSKGAAHIFRKFDPAVDMGKDMKEWESHNFVMQYVNRPDEWDVYAEDMIMMVRFWGCSFLPEDNITDLRQHFDKRGYGRFIMYKRDFTEEVIKSSSANEDISKTIKSNEEIINNYVRKLNTFFNRHGHRVQFPEILEQALVFDPNATQKYDCLVSAGYTLIASEKSDNATWEEEVISIDNFLPIFDISGAKSKPWENQA